MERTSMEYDVVIVGAGPAGLSAAIKLKQQDTHDQWQICVLEKGAEVGAHILSGAVFEPHALNELLPDWAEDESHPFQTPVKKDRFEWFSANKGWRLPSSLLPKELKNRGNYIVSLGNVCRWLAEKAENLGVDVFPGFPGAKALFDKKNQRVIGVRTGDFGLDHDGQAKATYEPGVDIYAKYTLLGEGTRGSISQQIINHFHLDQDSDPQTYGLGMKELWQIDPANHQPGLVMHTAGWPMDRHTWGGSFVYHLQDNQVAIGYVIGLDYQNPYLSPFDEFQRFKTHPKIATMLKGGKRLSYGARAINEGGLQSLPELTFPGGALIGCSAGFVNVAKIKGSHNAMKSGMLAANAIAKQLTSTQPEDYLSDYPEAVKHSRIYQELHTQRNFRRAVSKWGMILGSLYNGLDLKLLRGRVPWTLHHQTPDHQSLKPKQHCQPIDYPKPDDILTFDRTTSVALSNVNHETNQPCHLQLTDPKIPVQYNLAHYDAPEQRYCPAQVYEIVTDRDTQQPYLQINFANCIHCKTCDIKDPKQNIHWTPPEGGGGPNYPNM